MASKNIRSQDRNFSLPKVVGFNLHNVQTNLHKSERLKQSFSEDLVYPITNGRVKTPKSALYPCHIKSLTNNTELINITCRLGYGILCSLIEALPTEIA